MCDLFVRGCRGKCVGPIETLDLIIWLKQCLSIFISAPSCTDPPKTGRCLAFFRRYYFNTTTACCHTFLYGGCDGNGNRYETLQSCQLACESGNKLCPPPGNEFPTFRWIAMFIVIDTMFWLFYKPIVKLC